MSLSGGTTCSSHNWHEVELQRQKEDDIRQKINDYETGVRGSLQPIFSGCMKQWLSYCTRLGKTHSTLHLVMYPSSLSVCPSVRPPVRPSVHLYICLPVCLYFSPLAAVSLCRVACLAETFPRVPVSGPFLPHLPGFQVPPDSGFPS